LHVHPWLVAVIVLAAALVALGAWVLIDQTRSSATEGLASPEVAAMIHKVHAAWNRYDAEAVVAFYAPNAVTEEIEAGVPRVVRRGHDQILARFRYMLDAARPVGIQGRVSTITQIGPYVSTRYSWSTSGTTMGQGFIVDKLDASGKIAHEWVIVGAP
jgi:hypothetical protein